MREGHMWVHILQDLDGARYATDLIVATGGRRAVLAVPNEPRQRPCSETDLA